MTGECTCPQARRIYSQGKEVAAGNREGACRYGKTPADFRKEPWG